ncbi:MAG: integrase core domain-containing protein [Thermoplasmata archaeon]
MTGTGNDWYLISIIDDHSIIACKLVHSATAMTILSVLVRAIRMFGKPRQVLTDHGTQFFSNKGGASLFDAFCRKNGIEHILAGVRKPTTIGKVERWHRTVEEELLSKCSDIKEFSERLLDYIEWYNTERPHWGIELRTPAEVYFADFKSMDELLSPAGVHEVP